MNEKDKIILSTVLLGMEVEALWDEVRELSLGQSGKVERLDMPLTPLQFLRDFVSQNKPCIISNATLHWPALSNWISDSYLIQALSTSSGSSQMVSVHLTPNGQADALVPLSEISTKNDASSSPSNSFCFASAHVQHMPFHEALKLISSSNNISENIHPKVIAYAQQQNDCFRSEYSVLSPDCDPHIPWASEALGCLPEAVNLWIGNHLSETSFHKDHYENLYAVVTGRKHFLLLPPTDVHRMYICDYPAAQYSYSQETGDFTLELDKPLRYVPWCSVNPFPSVQTKEEEMAKFPLYFKGPKPFECTVNPGEILYLPSMWFHHVRQSPDDSGRAIAVNYWYDMQFDIKYAYFNFLQSIHHSAIQNAELPETESKESESDTENCVSDEMGSDFS